MFGMSMTEILMIMAIVLIVVGPEKIPEVAKTLGKGMREVRKASNLLRDAMMVEDSANLMSTIKDPFNVDFDNNVESDLPFKNADFQKDPTPEKNVEWVALGRELPEESAYSEVAVVAVANAQVHREVYLHIPYEETV